MFFQPLIVAALALAATANPIVKEQQPVLGDETRGQQVDLIKEFVSPLHHLMDKHPQYSWRTYILTF